MPELSLIIATLRRAALLERLFCSLLEQTVPLEVFELVIVDNDPAGDPATAALCRLPDFTARLRIIYTHCPVPGLSAARNHGLKLVSSDLVGFVDDDETLPAGWVERVIQISQKYNPDAFGGPYIPYYIEPKPAWFKDEYMKIALRPEAHWLDANESLFGGNMVYKKQGLVEMGGFSVKFGRVGNNLEYGEETDLLKRMAQHGARIWYDPELFIFHYAPPERMTVKWNLRSKWYHGKAKGRILFAAPQHRDSRSKPSILLSALKALLNQWLLISGLLIRLPFRNRQKYPFRQNYLLEVVGPRLSGLSSAWYFLKLSAQ